MVCFDVMTNKRVCTHSNFIIDKHYAYTHVKIEYFVDQRMRLRFNVGLD